MLTGYLVCLRHRGAWRKKMCIHCFFSKVERVWKSGKICSHSSGIILEYKRYEARRKVNRLIPVTVLCGPLFFDLSPMHFHIFHTFSKHYAQNPQMLALCMVKGGSKASQIHFKRLSSPSLSLYEVKKSAVFNAFPFVIALVEKKKKKKEALKLLFEGLWFIRFRWLKISLSDAK